MRTLIIACLLMVSAAAQCQTSQDSTQNRISAIQENLARYQSQYKEGMGVFCFGVALGAGTMISLDKKKDADQVKKGLYGCSVGCLIVGLLIQMEAVKYIDRASTIGIGPGVVTYKF